MTGDMPGACLEAVRGSTPFQSHHNDKYSVHLQFFISIAFVIAIVSFAVYRYCVNLTPSLVLPGNPLPENCCRDADPCIALVVPS